jgi:hypothetical protein
MINHPDNPNDESDAELDRLLGEASWPEMTRETRRRLATTYRQARRPTWNLRLRFSPTLWSLATAAGIAIVVGAWIFRAEPAQTDFVLELTLDQPKYLAISVNPPELTQRSEPIVGREPTMYERMMTIPPKRAVSPLAANANKAAVATVPIVSPDETTALINQFSSPSIETRFKAAEALAASGSPEVVPVLIDLVKRKVHEREALLALRLCPQDAARVAMKSLSISPASESQLSADVYGQVPESGNQKFSMRS